MTRITVSPDARLGPFSRLSGVQGSPLPIAVGDVDHSAAFRELRIEHCRIDQDCAPNTLTLGGIFPDAAADPELASSYRFAEIDRHISAARASGARVLWQSSYDIGASDRWVGLNLGGRPPTDLPRWGRVIERCLEHFNAGWANGLDRAVDSVEFLNEPDGLGGFTGADRPRLLPVFLEFLAVVARYNAKNPGARVGAVGPGLPFSLAEWPRFAAPVREGLARVRDTGRELTAFSFHTYGDDVSPSANATLARALRGVLDDLGMGSIELWNTEWQSGDHLARALHVDRARAAEATLPEQRLYASGMVAYTLACKMRWQGVVDRSYHYRANVRVFPPGEGPLGGAHSAGVGRFFATDGAPGRLALGEQLTDVALAAAPIRCATDAADEDALTVLGLRSEDAKVIALLGSNLAPDARAVTLVLPSTGAGPARVRVRTIDGDRDGIVEAESVVPGPVDGRLEIPLTLAALSSGLVVVDLR